MVGDTPSGTGRVRKPQLTQSQQQLLAGRIDKVRSAHNGGMSLQQIEEDFAGSVYDIKELVSSTVDAVDLLTTLTLHGSMKIELAAFLGVWQQKIDTTKDVLKIQEISGLQALNLHPKSLEDLVRGLSRELVRQIDGVDYSAPVKSTAQASAPKFESAADILAFMNKRPEPRPVQSGPVSRTWSYATHGSKTMLDLLAILPESLGKSVTPAKAARPKDKDESAKAARPKDKDESPTKTARPKDKDESKGVAKTGGKLPTKAALLKHLQSLNGETDTVIRDKLVRGLKGDRTVQATLTLMDEAGLPRP